MNLRALINVAVETQEAAIQPRLRAAMELGARFAIEAVLAKNPYSSDAKDVRDEFDGKTQEQPEAVGV